MSNKGGKTKQVTLGLAGSENSNPADNNPATRAVANFGGPG